MTPGKNCIVFACDKGYLLPSLVAAKMAKTHAPANTDVRVMVDEVGIPEEALAQMEAASGAQVRLIAKDVIDEVTNRIAPDHFEGSTLTRAALFRLFVGVLIESDYDRILYLDGDIQIRRSLAPLFELDFPDDHVAGVKDWWPLHACAGIQLTPEVMSYFSGLELTPEETKSYFNTGVTLATPNTWKSIGRDALEYFYKNPKKCFFADQSALNHVCRGRITHISPRWNFLRSFMDLPSFQQIDPAIIHYSSRPKPWDGAFAPWTHAEFQPYVDMMRALEGTGVVWRRQPFLNRMGYRFKRVIGKPEFPDPVQRAALDDIMLRASGIKRAA